MFATIEIACLLLLGCLVAGSLLNLSSHPHWFIRGWDFPRVQIMALGVLFAVIYFASRKIGGGYVDVSWNWMAVGSVACLILWHAIRVVAYTPIASTQVKPADSDGTGNSLRVVVSNVQQCNDQYDRWLSTIRDARPDLLIALEIDDKWLAEIASLRDEYEDEILQPQDNCYGMILLSKFPVIDFDIRFIIQDDVPSIDAIVRLPCSQEIRVVGVHPRPPEPIRDKNSSERDAELVIVGRELRHEQRPAIIGGDLNDVAWSRTTRLFLKTSQLLDPRRGRGFFNSFHADHWWMRFPLDHLFHSQHFKLIELRRLSKVGSDHFPMLIELHFAGEVQPENKTLEETQADRREADKLAQRESNSSELSRSFSE